MKVSHPPREQRHDRPDHVLRAIDLALKASNYKHPLARKRFWSAVSSGMGSDELYARLVWASGKYRRGLMRSRDFQTGTWIKIPGRMRY